MRASTIGFIWIVLIAGYHGNQKSSEASTIQAASQHAPPETAKGPAKANAASKKQENAAYEETRDYLKRGFGPEYFAAWVLVIAAGIGLYVTWRTAKAALLNAQAVINSERAWIEIDLGEPGPEELDGNGDDYARYSIQIENRGRTVARIESCQIGSKSFGGEISLEKIGYRPLRVFSLLGSNQRRSVGNITFCDEFSDDDWDAIQSGIKSAVVRVIVRYRDAVDISKTRETSVLFTWDPRNEHPERMPAFDEYK
ncbi:MAG: hypothetical protein WAL55_08390 [Candidatus Acidiferrales bacterium]